jgi:CRISPR type III-B/RAMP module-associated protein Cmr3
MTTAAFLRPVDRLYFGPPRGHPAGEIHGGRSEFPPSPHTVAGILRTHLLRDAEQRGALVHALCDRARDAVGARTALVGIRDRLAAGWRLGPTLPAQRTSTGAVMPWLAMPRCLAWPKASDASDASEPVFLQCVRWPGDRQPAFLSDDMSVRATWFAPPPGRLRESAPRWLSARDLCAVLDGKISTGLAAAAGLLPPFVHREPWTGVAITDATRRARDHLLYTLDMLRFEHGSGLVTWAEVPHRGGLDPAALSRGVARAGSKGHLVHFEAATVDAAWAELATAPPLDATSPSDTRALLYLATPARLDDPRDPVPALPPASASLTVTVLAAFVDEPMPIGGLDTVTMQPQTNTQHVAPGTCWIVRVAGGAPADRASWLRSLHASHALAGPDAAAFGYGLTFIGRLPPAVFQGELDARP